MKRLVLFFCCLAFGLHADEWNQGIRTAVGLHKKGQLKAAEASLLKTLYVAEGFGEDDPRLAYTLDYLGTLNMQMALPDKAAAVFERAVRCFKASRGEQHEETLQSMGRLAEAYEAMKDYAKAEGIYRQLLLANTKDPIQRATDLNSLAVALDAQDKQDEALGHYSEALAIREEKLGPQSSELPEILNNIARVYYMKGAYAKAEPLYRRAIAIDEKLLGPKDPLLADDLLRLAPLLRHTGREAEAIEIEKRAAQIQKTPKKKKAGKP